jgi:hypothetical protein
MRRASRLADASATRLLPHSASDGRLWHPPNVEVALPARVVEQLTTEIAHAAADAFTDQVVFPHRVVVDRVDEPDRLFPGWDTSVLVLAVENQGVCAWGVPIGQDDPPVLVGGDLEQGECTLGYTSSVGEYIAARMWDRGCLATVPLVQAQADPVEELAVEHLRDHFQRATETAGWPTRKQYRFERGDVRLMLWSGAEQCDWWISGPTDQVHRVVGELRPLSNLTGALWSNDKQGQALLTDLGIEGPWR